MTERPILMSAPMVRATLRKVDPKSQTRRIAKLNSAGRVARGGRNWHVADPAAVAACPYGQPGDRLWVRETHSVRIRPEDATDGVGRVWYAADGNDYGDRVVWTPSIHMYRWASRILLEVTGVRIERLNACSAADAIAEGIRPHGEGWERYTVDPDAPIGQPFTRNPVLAYRGLWDHINGLGSWEANPLVWVVEFKRVEQPGKQE